MRKLNLISGALGFAALALTACSNDDLKVPVDQKAEVDENRFISIQISAPSDLKTRGFENGSGNESYINRLDFFFYDASGRPTAQPVSMDLGDIEQAVEAGEGFFNENTGTNVNVTRVFTTVVPAALTQGQNLPSQVICIVNGEGEAIASLKNVTLSDLIDKERSTYRTDSYFTMSNSVYYGQNVLTGQADQRLCATPININTQLFGTRDEAVAVVKNSQDDDVANDGALVDIYVERLAAKIGLSMVSTAVNEIVVKNVAGEDVHLKFVPEYWTVNATDKSVYLTKRYGVENKTTETVDGKEVTTVTINRLPTYAEINTALAGGVSPWWNDPTNFRSYWGTSPSYFDNEYPDVADDVNDLDGYTGVYNTNYYSYNEVANQAKRTDAGAAGIGKQALPATAQGAFTLGTGEYIFGTGEDATTVTTSTGYIYTRETTVSRYRINDIENSNPAAAVASAVVVGKYTVDDAAVTTAFYIDRNAGTNGIYYPSAADVQTVLGGRQRILFSTRTVVDGVASLSNRLAANDPRFVIKHPSKAVRELAGTKLAGRLVTLQLDNYEGTPIYFYRLNEDGTSEAVQVQSQAELDEVNAQLLTVGYMDMFAQGLGFYSIPIRHLNWNDAWYNAATGVYDWENMASGALGVVRNHVYSLTIDRINGLATALRSPEQPIVPAKEEANQYIAARLNVLAWNIVNEWHVNL